MGFVRASLAWLEQFMEGFTPYLNKMVIFFLILFVGFLIGKILSRLTRKILSQLKTDATMKRTVGWRFSIERGISSLVAGLIYLCTFIIALNAVGLTTVMLEIIVGVFILALVISLLLAIRDVLPNASAGITLRRRLKVGMCIKLDDAEGVIEELNFLETVIETKQGDTIIVPNALFTRQRLRITNQSKSKKR